jgi:hypothetical protein
MVYGMPFGWLLSFWEQKLKLKAEPKRALMSVQERCTVCTKHTIGIEIVLDAHDGTHFDLF